MPGHCAPHDFSNVLLVARCRAPLLAMLEYKHTYPLYCQCPSVRTIFLRFFLSVKLLNEGELGQICPSSLK